MKKIDGWGHDACLSDLVLDRLRTGELQPSSDVAAHVGTCAGCAARMAALRADARRFADESFVPGLAADARARARGRRLSMPVWSGLLAAAAVLLLYVHSRPPEPSLRTKGRGALDLVVRRADGRVEPVDAGTLLHPDELVRFIVSTDESGYLMIVGADARQAVTVYQPTTGQPRTLPAGRHIIDGSVVLDDALGPERMIAVLCARPPSVDAVTAAARKALARADGDPRRMSTLDLDCRQLSFVIEKAATR
jgi:hypothetical protein